jgi:hypothetical protein
MDDMENDAAGLAKCVPPITVRMGIRPRQRQWISQRDFADAQRQLVFATVDRVLFRISRPQQDVLL